MVVVDERPLTQRVPLATIEDRTMCAGRPARRVVTQFTRRTVERMGLLHLDLLGLNALDLTKRSVGIVEEAFGERPDLQAVPDDDRTAYELLGSGDTDGIFGFHNDLARAAMRAIMPDTIEDLAAIHALARPGVTHVLEAYAQAKRELDSVTYLGRMPVGVM